MFRPRALHLASVLLIATLPVLLTLKIMQVHRERLLESGNLSVGSFLPYALARRFDDPSFWATIACCVSVVLVVRSRDRLFPVSSPWCNKLSAPRWAYTLWILSAVTVGCAYLIAVYLKSETFFFRYGRVVPQPGRDPIVLAIQHVEGFINLLIILLSTMVFPVAIHCMHVLRKRSANPSMRGLPDHRSAAKCLVNTWIGPFSMAWLCWVYQGTIASILGANVIWFQDWKLVTGAVMMTFLLWPFLVLLFFYFRWLWPPYPAKPFQADLPHLVEHALNTLRHRGFKIPSIAGFVLVLIAIPSSLAGGIWLELRDTP